ncbi:hypothetical protein [Streptomyces sp. NPDC046805]|uniref:DUF7178 family protein n=1 Tax=Streptomyces sp. NPDC046805 TaxID=3155134 RepID=UPI0033C32054
MIPTRIDDATREGYVQNIISAWHRATPEQVARGRAWYPTAHGLATVIADGETRKGAGVIAALSANKSWSLNCRLARGALRSGRASGHVRDALCKAERIMLGEDPEDVLPMGLKTGNFFRCIADPSDLDAVVIDRHAHDIAVGDTYGTRDRGLTNPNRYALLAQVYREAAHRLGELPATVQSVTWVAHTERLASTSTRGPIEPVEIDGVTFYAPPSREEDSS